MKSTHTSFCIAFVCGSPGSGKSFCMTRDVIDRLCQVFEAPPTPAEPASDDGDEPSCSPFRIYTNLPLNVPEVAAHVAAKCGCEPTTVINAIRLIDRDTLRRWADGQGGPWEIAEAGNAQGAELLLDECHIYCSKKQRARHLLWEKWLGEARHEGWRRVIFITQDVSKVGPPIIDHSELRFELTNSERRRDPLLQIPMAYWYELIASFTREYRSSIAITERRRVDGKMKVQHVDRVPLDPFWFRFYNSYEAAGGGTGRGQGSTAQRREFEKRPIFLPKRADGKVWLPTWLWFLKRYAFRFATAAVLFCCVTWLVALGGMQTLINGWISHITAVTGSKPKSSAVADKATGDQIKDEPPPRVELGTVLGRLSEPERDAILYEFQKAANEVRAKNKQLETWKAEHERERALHTVVALTDDQVWFTNPPCSCKVGKYLDEGPYKGKLVRRIDVNEGWALLDGGIRLWVGRGQPDRLPGAESEDGAAGEAAAGNNGQRNAQRTGQLPRALPSPSAEGDRPQLASAEVGADIDLRAGNEAQRLRPQSGLRSVLVRRDVGEPRREDADARSP